MRLPARIPVFLLLSLVLLAGCKCTRFDLERNREAALRQNLYHLRQSIDQYTIDKNKAPQTLQDIVKAGYLREIPVDPITGRRETWVVEKEAVYLSIGSSPGITDVRSGSTETGCDGTKYSTW